MLQWLPATDLLTAQVQLAKISSSKFSSVNILIPDSTTAVGVVSRNTGAQLPVTSTAHSSGTVAVMPSRILASERENSECSKIQTAVNNAFGGWQCGHSERRAICYRSY